MTVKVSGHVIDRLTKKIVKNVIKDEVGHNSAYRHMCEHLKKPLSCSSNHLKCIVCQNFDCKNLEKWRLFCFVFVLSTSKLSGKDDDRNYDRNDGKARISSLVARCNDEVTSIRPNLLILIYSLGDSNLEHVSVVLLMELLNTLLVLFNSCVVHHSSLVARRVLFVARLLVTNLLVLIYLPNSGRLTTKSVHLQPNTVDYCDYRD